MIDDFAKQCLHEELREIRSALLWKLDGLSDDAYWAAYRVKIEQAAEATISR